jgi:hypothetical protein
MTQITGGSVTVEDGIKKAEEYTPPRKVSVTLTFGVEEGGDHQAIFDLASEQASTRVAKLLGKSIDFAARNGSDDAAASNETKPATRKRRTAAEIAADAALAAVAHPKGTEGAAKDPAAVDDFEIEPEPSETQTPADDFAIEPEPEPEGDAEITDAALNAAVQRKNAELSDPEAIRGLIKQYNPDPTKAFQLREIPQTKRAEFITKLGGLTKATA